MKFEVNIRKNLRDFVLNVNFSTCNEIFTFLGASGCSKSMTLKCIAGIENPYEGKIILNGRILFDSDKKINLPPLVQRLKKLKTCAKIFCVLNSAGLKILILPN